MTVDELISKPGVWLRSSDDAEVTISSRMRLARNLKGAAFPSWAGQDECVRICGRVRAALEAVPALGPVGFFDMGALSEVDKEVLKERHLISSDLCEKGRGSGLVVTPDEQTAVMVNEEDHLRIQAICPGFNLAGLWKQIGELDSALERRLEFAVSRELGYLTACPSNVGTGLRASVMMHLPGLKLIGEIDPVVNGLSRIGLAVRGLLGEGTDAMGCMYQVSNQVTLGESEETIIERLIQVVNEVVKHELNARARLMESRGDYVLDHVGRAFGLLLHARVLASGEMLDFLSALRLGLELGLVRGLTIATINEIMVLSQPGHMQKVAGKVLSPAERDCRRAELVAGKLRRVRLVG